MRRAKRVIQHGLLTVSLIICAEALAQSEKQSCQYITAEGVITIVDSKQEVPKPYRGVAKCKTLKISEKPPATSTAAENSSNSHEMCFYVDSAGKRQMANGKELVPNAFKLTARCFKMPPQVPTKQLVATKNLKQQKEGTRCAFENARGKVQIVESIRKVPPRYKKQAKCGPAVFGGLVSPDKINIDGRSRYQEINTPLGTGLLRWARSVERDFGRTPLRSTIEAARAVKRAIRKPGFPSKLSDLDLPLKIVFLDEKIPETQIPRKLISNCHPGWMTPRANIYIVGQRIAAGCSGGPKLSANVADSRMAEVLVHELGHAIEYELLGKRQMHGDRMRAEGFASWFERYVAQYSSLLSRSSLERRARKLAQDSYKKNPEVFVFRGTGSDYARASFYFDAIVKKKGVRGLIKIYEELGSKGGSFLAVAKKQLRYSDKKLEEEVKRLVFK